MKFKAVVCIDKWLTIKYDMQLTGKEFKESDKNIYVKNNDKLTFRLYRYDGQVNVNLLVYLDDNAIVNKECDISIDGYFECKKINIFDSDVLCKLAVQQHGYALPNVKEQTEEICKLAVQQNGYALQFVKEQTEEICKLAVQQHGYTLKFVKEQTEDICKLAVQQNGDALQYVEKQTEETCKLAVQQNGYALKYIKEKTEEICKLAVQQNGYVLEYVKKQTEEICKLAVQKNGYALQFVKEQTEEICKLAIQQNRLALKYIKNLTTHNLIFQHNLIKIYLNETKDKMTICNSKYSKTISKNDLISNLITFELLIELANNQKENTYLEKYDMKYKMNVTDNEFRIEIEMPRVYPMASIKETICL